MADVCCEYTFGSLTINPTDVSDDHLQMVEDGILGLESAPIRRQRDPASRLDGSNVFHAYYSGKILVFKALMVIASVGHENGLTDEYLTAYNAFEDAVVAALEAQLNTPTNLAWTPTGASPKTLSCVYGGDGDQVSFTGPMISRTCEFTLLEAEEIID